MSKELKKGPRIVPLDEIDIKGIEEISTMQKMATKKMTIRDAKAKYSFGFDGSNAFINPMTGNNMLPTWNKMSLDPNEDITTQNSVVNREGANLIVIMATTDAGFFRIIVR